jgi:hypothetical protein
MLRVLGVGLLVVAALIGTTNIAAAQGRTVKLSAGLEASIGFIGRDASGRRLTVTLKLLNKGAETVFGVLVREALAIDNSGAGYDLNAVSGITQCPWQQNVDFNVAQCLGAHNNHDRSTVAPLESFTQIDPGSETTVTFALRREESGTGTIASFATVLIYRVVRDPLVDETLSDADRRRGLRTLNISIPEHPITQGK